VKKLLNQFYKEREGSVVQWIMVLAFISVIIVFMFPQTEFYTKYFTIQLIENGNKAINGEYVPEASPSNPSDPTSGYIIGKEVNNVLYKPVIEMDRDGTLYFNNTNDIAFKAISQGGNSYKPKEPYTCQWDGYKDYFGKSCNPNVKAVFGLGEHTIKVKMCDSRGACGETSMKFNILFEPLASQIRRWDNYIKNHTWGTASGEWKYDTEKEQIYSTKNVGWTGFWNPADVNYQNYEIQYKTTVDPHNDDDVLGMSFRMTDIDHMYVLSIDRYPLLKGSAGVNGLHSGLYKVNGNTYTLLQSLPNEYWKPATFDSFKIRLEDNNIKIWKNGTQIIDYTDTNNPYLTGAWGPFSVSQANAIYKDLSIQIIE